METASSVSPENAGGPFSFKVGEEGFGFDGEFTKGKFTGMIRGTDGEEFAGLVEDLGGGRYKIEDYEGGRIIESPAEVGTAAAEALAAAPAEVSVGGMEDAAAVAAAEAPVGGKGDDFGGYRLAPDVKGGIAKKDKLIGEIIGPDGQRFVGIVKQTPEGLKVVGAKGKEGFIKTPEKEIVGRIETPPAEVPSAPPVAATAAERVEAAAPAPEAAAAVEPTLVAESEPAPQPEIAVAPAEVGQRLTAAEARQQFNQEFNDSDARARQARYDAEQKTSLQKQSQELRAEADKARRSVNKLRNPQKISERFSEEGRLVAEAKRLEGQAATINALEDADIRAIEDRRQRARDLTQEVDRWGNLIENPALIEEYRGLDGRMQADLAAAEKLFGGGNPEDQQVLDAAKKRIEARIQVRRTELGAMFQRRFMELAGMAPRQDLGEAAIDSTTLDRDLIERYYQFADQFYAELTGGPQAVQSEIPPVPEPVAPPEPVEQPVVETTVEEVMPSAEVLAEPEAAEQAAEVIAPPVTEGEAAPEPVEEPIEATVVVDEKERARAAAAKPAGTAEELISEDQDRFDADTLDAARQQAAEAAVEALAAEEAAAETPEQRFERRKQGFAGALAELDRARGDTSGTEGEQKIRLAEAFNQAVGAAMEFMKEGDAAKGVVGEFLAGALGTPGGRKLTEVAVRSRMDEAGVFQAATAEERKRKLEEAGLWGLLALLLELGMSFTDKTVEAVVGEVQSATGAGR